MAQDILSKTRRWAEAFTAPMPQGLDDLMALATPDVRFSDPFNDVRGQAELREIVLDMVARCAEPEFTILDITASEKAGYIRWSFNFRPKGSRKAWQFEGMSEIQFDPETGLVLAHIDHWDSGAQLYAKLPLIGWVIRKIQRSLGVTLPQT